MDVIPELEPYFAKFCELIENRHHRRIEPSKISVFILNIWANGFLNNYPTMPSNHTSYSDQLLYEIGLLAFIIQKGMREGMDAVLIWKLSYI